MEDSGISCKKKAKWDAKSTRLLKSQRLTDIPVCIVEDHCDVSFYQSINQSVMNLLWPEYLKHC